jgi:hypothetical protein
MLHEYHFSWTKSNLQNETKLNLFINFYACKVYHYLKYLDFVLFDNIFSLLFQINNLKLINMDNS